MLLTLFSLIWLTSAKLPEVPYEITLRGSLTQSLRNQYASVSIKPLSHQWQTLPEPVAKYLNLPLHSQGWVREVVILGDQEPVIYAISVFPKELIEKDGENFQTLKTKPLGDVLFKDKNVFRSQLESTQLPKELSQQICVRANTDSDCSKLWARRSYFLIRNQRILVVEVFLLIS